MFTRHRIPDVSPFLSAYWGYYCIFSGLPGWERRSQTCPSEDRPLLSASLQAHFFILAWLCLLCFLSVSGLTIMCPSMDFFLIILLGISWTSGICGLVHFISSGKSWDYLFKCCFAEFLFSYLSRTPVKYTSCLLIIFPVSLSPFVFFIVLLFCAAFWMIPTGLYFNFYSSLSFQFSLIYCQTHPFHFVPYITFIYSLYQPVKMCMYIIPAVTWLKIT